MSMQPRINEEVEAMRAELRAAREAIGSVERLFPQAVRHTMEARHRMIACASRLNELVASLAAARMTGEDAPLVAQRAAEDTPLFAILPALHRAGDTTLDPDEEGERTR